MVSANAVIPAVLAGELTSPFSIPLAALVPGASPLLFVPLYPVRECPTMSSIAVSAYVPAWSPLLVIPVSSPGEALGGFGQPVAALVAGLDPAPSGDLAPNFDDESNLALKSALGI